MQFGSRAGEGSGDSTSDLRMMTHLIWNGVSDRYTGDVLHNEESGAGHRIIQAEVDGSRHTSEHRFKHFEYPEFTFHVVSARGDDSEWWPTKNQFAVVKLQKIG